MSSVSSFDTESVESDLQETQSIKSKTPDSINPFDTENSSVSGQSELENSPTERRNSTQERKTGIIVDKQPSDSRGLSRALLSRVRNFRTFILQNPQYREETSKWSSKSEPYSRLKELNILAAYDYDEDKQGICRKSKPIEGIVSSRDFDAASLFKEWSIIQRALNTARKNNLFSSELEKPDIDSSEEESSDDDDTRSSRSPEPVRPEVRNQHPRKLQRRVLPTIQSNHDSNEYGGEWKGVSELLKAQNRQLKKQRQDMEALQEIVRGLQVRAQPTASTPMTTAGTKKSSLFQPPKHLSMRTQFKQSPDHRNPQTPPLGRDYPRADTRYHASNEQTPTAAPQTPTHIGGSTPREWPPVPGAQFGESAHAISVGNLQRQPNLPVELRQEQENHPRKYYDNVLIARSDILNFKISDLGIFEPTKERKLGPEEQTYWGGEYNVFSDVHSWIQAVDDNWSRINPSEQHIVTRNLWTLLRGPAIGWWRSQLSQQDREELQASKEKMLQAVEREFRLDVSDAVDILETSKFDRQDIMGDASIHSFAYKIFKAAKACGGTSNEHLLTRLYLALDPDLQVFVNSPTSTDTLSEYVKMIEEKRKAFRRKEGTENAQKVHLVGGNSYPQEGGSYDEPLHSTDNTLHTTEKSNWRSQQHVNKRNDFDPNNWPYERHEQYYQNGRYFPRRNAPRFQRMVPHSYNHDRKRDVGENLIGQQQERNRGGGYGYYDHEFDTNNLEAYWKPHVSGQRIDEQAPYGFNPQRMVWNRSRHQIQDQSFQGRYHGQHEQNSYQPNESWTTLPTNEGLRYDSHPRLLGPAEAGVNGH
ncbi:hypothetical protein FOMA001_g17410 [Fusarium oxysporum f. sp. matthiolae]|nr:hypothetical protein FOMA001_g17410 [Fusarium oxysporum f. sp. matthiolae]